MAHPIPELSDSWTHRPLFRPEADSQGDSEGPPLLIKFYGKNK